MAFSAGSLPAIIATNKSNESLGLLIIQSPPSYLESSLKKAPLEAQSKSTVVSIYQPAGDFEKDGADIFKKQLETSLAPIYRKMDKLHYYLVEDEHVWVFEENIAHVYNEVLRYLDPSGLSDAPVRASADTKLSTKSPKASLEGGNYRLLSAR
jgi:hypothetical protein